MNGQHATVEYPAAPPARHRLAGAILCALLSSLALGGCHETAVPSSNANTSPDPAPAATPDPPPEPVPTRVTIEAVGEDPNRWLAVRGVEQGEAGGWATGSFDEQRNRLDIQTKHLTAFTVDVGRIPIRWEKLVVLSIDGRTSELRRRDTDVFEFKLDEHANWIVSEP